MSVLCYCWVSLGKKSKCLNLLQRSPVVIILESCCCKSTASHTGLLKFISCNTIVYVPPNCLPLSTQSGPYCRLHFEETTRWVSLLSSPHLLFTQNISGHVLVCLWLCYQILMIFEKSQIFWKISAVLEPDTARRFIQLVDLCSPFSYSLLLDTNFTFADLFL